MESKINHDGVTGKRMGAIFEDMVIKKLPIINYINPG